MLLFGPTLVRRASLAAVLAALALAGCGGGDDTDAGNPPPRPQPRPAPASADEAVIRGWTRALFEGDYERAGGYFAPGAVVQQTQKFVLRDHKAAVFFGQSLPCRAKVTEIVRERRGQLLASFDLFPGSNGQCPKGGSARVRFGIRDGRIVTWRQLPDQPAPEGQAT